MKHTTKRTIWVGVAILTIVVIWIKWDSWFYNPPEPVYHPSPEPGRILISWSGDATNSRDVTWEGDTINHQGTLQVTGKSFNGDTTTYNAKSKILKTSGGASAFFRVALRNLNGGETYQYRVANGNLWSDWYSFKMGNVKDSTFSFIYIGDVQDSINGSAGKLFHRASESRPDADFMLFIGDMIERPHDAYWGEWFRSGGNLFRTIPILATPGNHEYHKGVIQRLDERWMAHFPFPQNGPENFKGRACYWDYQNTRIISLDSNGIQSLPSALEQRKWLKSVLENTHKRWIIVIMHHPLYSTSRGRDYFYLRTLFKSLFDQYNVDLVLSGHDHSYGRAAHIPADQGDDKPGTVYIVTHASPKVYDLKFSDKMDKLASNTQMYQILDVSADSIKFGAFTTNGSPFDGFTIRKDAAGIKSISYQQLPNNAKYLMPTNRFLRTNSKKDIEKYNLERDQWLKNNN